MRLLRRLSLLFASVFLFAFSVPLASGCGTLAGKKVDWPAVVSDCAPNVPDAIGKVSGILLNDGSGWKDQLKDVAISEGPKTVACLVQRLVNDWSSPGAAQDPGVTAAADRGRAFLAEVGTTVRLDDGGGGT